MQCSGAAISGVHFGRPDYSMISVEDVVHCSHCAQRDRTGDGGR